ncbi:hypothetical protein RDI58_014742 [Solanum bulbocastanum]|uniref:Uncharacterized protein n=1 Tax=Solanum bulbocastanum TaxID=147425 RepID=A0AAN8TJJ9_SOLBU
MATAPPGMPLRPLDLSQSEWNSNSYKPQPDASSDSSANSSKLRRIEAIHIAISEEELDWARKIMSLEQSGMIRVNSTVIRNLQLKIYHQSKNQTFPSHKLKDSRKGILGKSPPNRRRCAFKFDHLPMEEMKFPTLGNRPQVKAHLPQRL